MVKQVMLAKTRVCGQRYTVEMRTWMLFDLFAIARLLRERSHLAQPVFPLNERDRGKATQRLRQLHTTTLQNDHHPENHGARHRGHYHPGCDLEPK